MAVAGSVIRSQLSRPMIRFALRLCLLLLITGAVCLPARAQSDADFQKFLQSLWPDAQAMGVSRKTFDEAKHGLKLNLSLPDLVIPGKPKEAPRGQAEFERTPEQYLSESSLARLTGQGQKLAAEHKATLAAIEKRFGLPPAVVLAIWVAKPITATSSCPTTRSRCWRRKPISAGARRCSGANCCWRCKSWKRSMWSSRT